MIVVELVENVYLNLFLATLVQILFFPKKIALVAILDLDP